MQRQQAIRPIRLTLVLLLLASIGCATVGSEAPRASAGADQTTLWDGAGTGERSASTALASSFGLAAPAGRIAAETEPPAGEEPPASTPEPAPATPARLMVYTARLELLVASVEEARDRFIDDVESRGGYLQKREGDSVTCRVPSREFDAVLEGVRKLGKVLDESLRALDVTKEYRDLEIQLDNAKKSRERLLALLEKATEVEDLLKIETELRRLTGEIERLQGQLKYLADQIALSTIEVVFRSNAPPVDPSRRVYSSFWWINQLGVDSVLDHF